jgi:hypothetical protein
VRQFLIPTTNDSGKVERAILQLPVVGPYNLYAAVSEVSIKIRNSFFQRTPCVFDSKGFGNNPQAELPAL